MHSKPKSSAKTAAPPPRRKWAQFCLAAASIATLVLVVLIGRDPTGPAVKGVSTQARDATVAQEVSLRKLFDPHTTEISGDIALANLACAQGLPGAEDLDMAQALKTLAAWCERVRHETDRHWHRFSQSRQEYNNSAAYFKMLMLVTVLQQDFGVRYNPERANDPDFTDSRDLFIHGLLGPDRTGTCMSMPALYVAVGRRLGYPLKLAQARRHLYVRWED
ncbi:MAG: hypothetical protein L0Z53_01390, partial [Acidobacteriales bacterium]|nr:hypothetical protein [Terriglobales bacterium]